MPVSTTTVQCCCPAAPHLTKMRTRRQPWKQAGAGGAPPGATLGPHAEGLVGLKSAEIEIHRAPTLKAVPTSITNTGSAT